MKKSQAEIVGIAIVMVLIMLGVVFVIRFIVLPENENIKQIYDQIQIGANFIDAMLITHTNCSGVTMTELIKNCFEQYDNPTSQHRCPEVPICDTPGGCRACEFLNATIEFMLNRSLDSINERYDFFICGWNQDEDRCEPDDIITNFTRNSCLAEGKELESKQSPIPTDVGPKVAQIYIC